MKRKNTVYLKPSVLDNIKQMKDRVSAETFNNYQITFKQALSQSGVVISNPNEFLLENKFDLDLLKKLFLFN